MSASSASTTIRSAFPFTLSPTVNCHDILAFLKATLRTSAPCVRPRSLFVRGDYRVASHSAHTPTCTKMWSGADAGLRGITCYMVRPMRASYIGISQQWRASSTNGNSVPLAQVTSIKVKDKSLNLIAWPSGDEFGLGGYRQRSAFWAFQNARCPLLMLWTAPPPMSAKDVGAVKYPRFGGMRMKVGCFGARMPR
jgi:hypothetical protein